MKLLARLPLLTMAVGALAQGPVALDTQVRGGLSISGDVLAVAGDNIAPRAGPDAVAVRLFRRGASGDWQEASYPGGLVPESILRRDRFGQSVSLGVRDGAWTLAVGAHGANATSGACLLLSLGAPPASGPWAGTWSRISASDAGPVDEFGRAVSISASLLAVGAPRSGGAGAVYLFGYSSDTKAWQQVGKIVPLDAKRGDQFGRSVSLVLDGQALAVGAPNVAGAGFGAVYAFDNPSSATPVGSKMSVGAGAQGLGASVALSADGNFLAAGAPDGGAQGLPNAAAVFAKGPTGWTLLQQIKRSASYGSATNLFGTYIALSEDGRSLAVGGVGSASLYYTYDGWASYTAAVDLNASSSTGSVLGLSLANSTLVASNAEPDGAKVWVWAGLSPPDTTTTSGLSSTTFSDVTSTTPVSTTVATTTAAPAKGLSGLMWALIILGILLAVGLLGLAGLYLVGRRRVRSTNEWPMASEMGGLPDPAASYSAS